MKKLQLTSVRPTLQIKLSPGIRICVLCLMFISSALTGLVSQTFLSFVIVVCMLALFLMDELYLAFPFLLFYNSFYGLFLGVSLFRIFSILMIFACVLKLQVNKPLDIKYFWPIFVYFVYLLAVMSSFSVTRAIYVFIDVICCVLLVTGDIKKDEEKLKAFFTIYVFVALAAYLTGTISGNELEQVERPGFQIVEYSRFMATFEDPNYMGFFYTIAVFAVFTLKLFKPLWRVLIIIILNIMMLTSLSITAIIVNVVLWLIYLVVSKKMNIRALIGIILVVFLAIAAYNYGLGAGKDSFLGNLVYRIQDKLQELEKNNIGAVTTGRSDLTAHHFEVYKSQPFFKILFGGMMANVYYFDPVLTGAAHNEYVDMLLNIGLIGAIVMLGFLIYNLVGYYKKYKQKGEERYIFLFMIKTVWILYAFTLTIFLDYRFMFFFLI